MPLIEIGSSRHIVEMVVKGNSKDITMHLDTAKTKLESSSDTAVQAVMKTAGKSASKILESGTEIITAPATWLKDMQQNWLTYMIVAAVILLSIGFLYCVVCFHFNRKKNNWSDSSFVELAKVINNKSGALQQPLPLSTNNLASLLPQSMA